MLWAGYVCKMTTKGTHYWRNFYMDKYGETGFDFHKLNDFSACLL